MLSVGKILVHRKYVYLGATLLLATFLLCPEVAFADSGVSEEPSLNGLLGLMKNVVKFLGDILMLFGLVQVGLTIKDGTTGGGGQLSGAVSMIIAGGVIRAVAQLVS